MEFEQIIMTYLAREGLFLSPQFIVLEKGKEWSRPDFIAINFKKKEIQVVEVTTAQDISRLMAKVADKNNQWFDKLIPQLKSSKVIPNEDDNGWTNVVRLFIREDCKQYAEKKVKGNDNVFIEILEDLAFSWKWPWDKWNQA
ncbi:MAG: hypothetical protein ACI8WB_003441 [Phenylobacterium sp.]|jgi:hypothetical protein